VADTDERHDNQLDEQLELYVLNLLDDDELRDVERRLGQDPVARERVRELRGTSAMLALTVEPVEASPGLKARILTAARADLDTERRTAAPPVPAAPIDIAERRAARAATRWIPWAVAAVLAIALAGSLVWNSLLRSELDDRPEFTSHAVAGSGPAAGVSGEVLVAGDQPAALLSLSGVAAPASGRVYQVWLIDEGAPVPSVTFVPDAAGNARVVVPGDVEQYSLLAVTDEPFGGSAAPTTEPFITSDLTQSTT
jgi:anti-sigma-K factor RskA